MEKFNFATAWIFASVTADGGVNLPLLIGAADSLNHAIPTRGEITRALKTLYACGLVDINGSHVQLTPHGRTVANDGFARRGGRFSIPDNMRQSLDAASHPTVAYEPDLSFVTDESLTAAFQEYRKMLRT